MTTQTLIVHGDNLKTAEKIALNLTGELESRKNHFRVHFHRLWMDLELPNTLKKLKSRIGDLSNV